MSEMEGNFSVEISFPERDPRAWLGLFFQLLATRHRLLCGIWLMMNAKVQVPAERSIDWWVVERPHSRKTVCYFFAFLSPFFMIRSMNWSIIQLHNSASFLFVCLFVYFLVGARKRNFSWNSNRKSAKNPSKCRHCFYWLDDQNEWQFFSRDAACLLDWVVVSFTRSFARFPCWSPMACRGWDCSFLAFFFWG